MLDHLNSDRSVSILFLRSCDSGYVLCIILPYWDATFLMFSMIMIAMGFLLNIIGIIFVGSKFRSGSFYQLFVEPVWCSLLTNKYLMFDMFW